MNSSGVVYHPFYPGTLQLKLGRALLASFQKFMIQRRALCKKKNRYRSLHGSYESLRNNILVALRASSQMYKIIVCWKSALKLYNIRDIQNLITHCFMLRRDRTTWGGLSSSHNDSSHFIQLSRFERRLLCRFRNKLPSRWQRYYISHS